MPKRIYVGNLPFDTSPDDLRPLLKGHEGVKGVEIKNDASTKSAMAVLAFEGEGPNTLIEALNGSTIGGRKIVASDDRKVVINHEEQYG